MGTVRDKGDEEIDSELGGLDPRVGIGLAVVLAAIVAGAGYVIIRRRRRRSLIKRLHEALPEVDDLRATLRRLQEALPEVDDLRAAVKRPLERAVKAL